MVWPDRKCQYSGIGQVDITMGSSNTQSEQDFSKGWEKCSNVFFFVVVVAKAIVC